MEYAAIAGGGVLSGIGSFLGSRKESEAAKKALQLQLEQEKRYREKAGELFGQYLPAGATGMEALQRQRDILLGGDMNQFYTSPGYQFRMDEGTKALERGAAARGGLFGGRQAKELTRFGQGTASQEFANVMSRLSGLTAQGTNIGMGASGNILGTYAPSGVAPQMMQQLGKAQGAAAASPWQTLGGIAQGMGGQMGYQQGMQGLGGAMGMPNVPSAQIQMPTYPQGGRVY